MHYLLQILFWSIFIISIIKLYLYNCVENYVENFSETTTSTETIGDLTIDNLDVTNSIDIFPSGIIVSWTGSIAPDGWALCDGTNGTPDLTNKFILGSNSGSGNNLTKRDFGSSGGEFFHTLTVDEIPAHNHNYNLSSGSRQINSHVSGAGYYRDAFTNNNHILATGNSGGNNPHNNIPPSYVLAYIMKL